MAEKIEKKLFKDSFDAFYREQSELGRQVKTLRGDQLKVLFDIDEEMQIE